MQALQELEQVVREVSATVGPSVVGLGGGWGVGSGFVVGEGRVLTNAHNIRSEPVTVVFADGRTAHGSLAGADAAAELAVIEVDTSTTPVLPWADEELTLGIGAGVVALANPGGRGLHATFGLVSATDRAFRGPEGRLIGGAVAHTAPLAPGSSGGPLMSPQGRLVAINTHRLGDGFYLAMPAGADLHARTEGLARGERPGRVRLGIAIAPAAAALRLRRSVGLPDREGLLVRGVEDGGPAARAGLRRGDLLVDAAGTQLGTPDDLFAVLDGLAEDATLPLTIVRGVEERTVIVRVSGDPEEGSA